MRVFVSVCGCIFISPSILMMLKSIKNIWIDMEKTMIRNYFWDLFHSDHIPVHWIHKSFKNRHFLLSNQNEFNNKKKFFIKLCCSKMDKISRKNQIICCCCFVIDGHLYIQIHLSSY